jgi:ABC-type sugar transport system ATPase subunit
MHEQSEAVLGRLGVDIDPRAMARDLSVSAQQMVEIAKALTVDASVIVMDEPTAALDDRETDLLFQVVEQLRDEGKGIIYVSHRLAEIFRIADRATVLRDGQSVGTVTVSDADEDQIIRMMVGRDVDAVFKRKRSAGSEVVFVAEGLNVGSSVRDVDFELHAGEILGFGGMDGCGAYELLQAVFGILPLRTGSMTLGGEPYRPRSPREALANGIGLLPSDRKATGLLPDLSVQHNVSISTVDQMTGSSRLVDRVRENRTVDWFAERLGMRFRDRIQPIRFLSGGNQQKVLIARVLAGDTKVLALAEPTRGVDVGAKGEIHDLLNELTEAGMAILMLSTDLLELLGMSDRAIVMHEGRVTGRLAGDSLNEEDVVACATGRVLGTETAKST